MGDAADQPALAYLDANATTVMPQEVLDAYVRWCNRGDPAAEYAGAREGRALLEAFRRELAAECGFELEGPAAYAVLFTSGASESNSHVVTSAVRAYAAKTGRLPHVVTSAAEHHSVLQCCRGLAAEQQCQLTVLEVARAGAALGTVAPAALAAALRPNTCLVTLAAAHPDTGALNPLRALARVARAAAVPFHTDAALLLGRAPLQAAAQGVDAFSASFHKLGGPPGVGLLVVRRAFADGYGLAPLVCGAPAGGLRGGLANLPGVAASFAAFRRAAAGRAEKGARLGRLRAALKAGVAARLPCLHLDEHPADPPPSIDGGITAPGPALHDGTPAGRRAIAEAARGGDPAVFWVEPADARRALPGTLLLAVRRPGFSAAAARAALERRGVLVGLGSVCGEARGPCPIAAVLGLPAELRGAVLRVSMSDDTTPAEALAFVRHFVAVVTTAECLAVE